jgi:hypothetical protein
MPVPYGDLGLLCQLIDTYCALAEREGAARVYRQWQPSAELNAVLPSFAYLGAVAQYLGQAARLLGWDAPADEHFRLAAALNRRPGMAAR